MVVVFDVDDILWGLNYFVTNKLDIDINLIKKFSINDNDTLSLEQKSSIIKEYRNPDTLSKLSWFDGVEDLNALQRDGVEVRIKSNCLSEEIKYIKLKRLIDILNIPIENIQLDVITMSEIKKKEISDDVDIFVDDSPYNIVSSNAKLNLMIRYPWNISDEAKELVRNKNVRYFDSLNEVISYIRSVMKA